LLCVLTLYGRAVCGRFGAGGGGIAAAASRLRQEFGGPLDFGGFRRALEQDQIDRPHPGGVIDRLPLSPAARPPGAPQSTAMGLFRKNSAC